MFPLLKESLSWEWVVGDVPPVALVMEGEDDLFPLLKSLEVGYGWMVVFHP